ncbi:MAG: NAD(P)-dependent alcohol dehydrogenase [Promethearchaeota archaeon]
MKAAVYEKYGPPEIVHIREVPKPVPTDIEVLVKVMATTVSAGDVRMRKFDVPGNLFVKFMGRLFLGVSGPKKKTLGMQLAGRVESVGSNVTKFKVGDDVFASTYPTGFGGHAEYKCFPEDTVIALMPTNVSYGEAATYPVPAMGALNVLKRANMQPGQSALVYGASGAVGTFAVQLLANHWAADVTAVCSESNFEMMRSLGATNFIDYTKANFADADETYDLIFDAVCKISSSNSKPTLKENGVFLSISSQGKENTAELIELREIVEAGKLKSVIDRTYSLEEIVEAYRYVDAGHKKGNVVITVSE